MDELPVKAIIIGVSVFVTMVVLTAILTYFNTARMVADTVSDRADVAGSYDSIVNSDNFEDELSGVEIRSLITKYIKNEYVKINIVKIGGQEPTEYKSGVNYNNVNNGSWLIKNENTYTIRETMLDIINPIWTCYVEKEKYEEITILKVYLNMKKEEI